MGVERCDGCWLWVGGPVVRGASAMTFGRLILVRRDAVADALLLRHEREHVSQWQAYGVAGFSLRYLRAYLAWRCRWYGHWAAYRRIPIEIEAEWAARRGAPVDTARSPIRALS